MIRFEYVYPNGSIVRVFSSALQFSQFSPGRHSVTSSLRRALNDRLIHTAAPAFPHKAPSPSVGAPLPAREGAGGMGAKRHERGGDA